MYIINPREEGRDLKWFLDYIARNYREREGTCRWIYRYTAGTLYSSGDLLHWWYRYIYGDKTLKTILRMKVFAGDGETRAWI